MEKSLFRQQKRKKTSVCGYCNPMLEIKPAALEPTIRPKLSFLPAAQVRALAPTREIALIYIQLKLSREDGQGGKSE